MCQARPGFVSIFWNERAKKEKIEGLAYVLGDDIDTDQTIPAEYLINSLSDPEGQAGLPTGKVP